MNPPFGPWSTAMSSDTALELSAFWKRRMALLPLLHHSKPALSRREFLGLGAAGFLAGAIPTLRAQNVIAKSQEEAPQGSQEPTLPGRLFARVWMRDAEGRLSLPIVSIDPQAGTWKKLVDDGLAPSVSPDGQTLAFVRDDGIWTCDTQRGENPGRISSVVGFPVWSPDSKRLLVTTTKPDPENPETEKYEFWRINADGTGYPSRVALADDHYVQDWSPDGNWLATSGPGAVYLMRSDGTLVRRFAERASRPSFSPDGRWVAFVPSLFHKVQIMGIDGKDERTIFQDGGGWVMTAPRWSPDGRWLAFVLADVHINARGEESVGPPLQSGERVVVVNIASGESRELKLAEQKGTRIWPGDSLDWR